MTDVGYAMVRFKVQKHLIGSGRNDAATPDAHAASLFPRLPHHPLNIGDHCAASPGICVGIDRKDGCERTINRDPDLKAAHGGGTRNGETNAAERARSKQCRTKSTGGQTGIEGKYEMLCFHRSL